MIGPGLLLAATGVGSGDLATGGIAGSLLGTAVLWAVVVGALLKFVVTEGLTRWQLATGETLLEGAVRRIGPVVLWFFLPYLFLWSFFVGSAQVSASGVTLHAMFPVFEDARDGKIAFGATLVHMLKAAVAERPDVVAVICEDRRVTYAEFGRAVAGFAARLGPLRGKRVVLLMANSIEMDIAILAVMPRAGRRRRSTRSREGDADRRRRDPDL